MGKQRLFWDLARTFASFDGFGSYEWARSGLVKDLGKVHLHALPLVLSEQIDAFLKTKLYVLTFLA